MASIAALDQWLAETESTTREYKSAQGGYSRSDAMKYCAAFANGKGGTLILGVDDSRQIVGTGAFQGTHHDFEHELFQYFGLQIEIEEILHTKGRVLVFHVPKHRAGIPVSVDGKYWMRAGSSIVEMDEVKLRSIVNEVEEDFSARIVSGMKIADLDHAALAAFRQRRVDKVGNPSLSEESIEQLLRDMHLVTDQGYTYACLILLGTKACIQKFLPQSEVIYEWRGDPAQTHHDFRQFWKEPYFLLYDALWKSINDRNIRTPYQEGFVQREVWSFDEKSCREAVNNAVCHRNYALLGSVYILASPASLIVLSPGGFPSGITPENVITHAPSPRNRLIAEVLEQTKIVERSGQGVNDIYEASIRQGKGYPSFEGTDQSQVSITVPANVQDTSFVRFVEKAINEKQVTLSIQEWVELESIRISGKVSSAHFRKKFLELGLIEQYGKTRGVHYVLAHRYYSGVGQRGLHTRLVGISRDAKKQLILNHLQKNTRGTLDEFSQAFPDVKRMAISTLLRDLRKSHVIRFIGSKRNGYWEISLKDHNNPS